MPYKKLICLPTDLLTKNTWIPFLHRNFGLYGKNRVETWYMFKKVPTYLPTYNNYWPLGSWLTIEFRSGPYGPENPNLTKKGPVWPCSGWCTGQSLFEIIFQSRARQHLRLFSKFREPLAWQYLRFLAIFWPIKDATLRPIQTVVHSALCGAFCYV